MLNGFNLQLETMIGKVKAEKYGDRILEEIDKWSIGQNPNASEEEQEEDENRTPKRPKTINTHVVIESSDEEAWCIQLTILSSRSNITTNPLVCSFLPHLLSFNCYLWNRSWILRGIHLSFKLLPSCHVLLVASNDHNLIWSKVYYSLLMDQNSILLIQQVRGWKIELLTFREN